MRTLKYAVAFMALVSTLTLQAQDAAGNSAAPRLPKHIPGLDEGQAGPADSNWLLNAKDDAERFRRIQIYAGGTYEQMWQIGYRYQQVYHAIVDQNWKLARHHWKKLRDVFNVALMKRPKRTPNAEALFLDGAWNQLDVALASENPTTAREVFLRERHVCMACHVAEDMGFLNETPLFRDTAGFPEN